MIIASGMGGLGTLQNELGAFAKGDGTPRFNPFFVPKIIIDIAAGQVSMRHGFRGPNYAVVSACASSTHAIIDAFDHIRLGKADIMLTGGAEAVVIEAGVGGFKPLKTSLYSGFTDKNKSMPFSPLPDCTLNWNLP